MTRAPVQTLYQAPAPRGHSPAPAKRAHGLLAAEETLLLAQYTYDFLTVKQGLRLFYESTSLNYVADLLRSTVQQGYAHQDFLPRKERFGSAPAIFFLSAKGVTHFLKLGYPPPHTHYAPAEISDFSYLFWKHSLAVNDVLIAAQTLVHEAPGYVVAAFQHDRELRKTPIYVQGDPGQPQIGVVPDLWLDFRLPVPPGQRLAPQIALHMELDRGSMPVGAMKRKFRALLRYIDGPYQAHFHTQSVTLCFPTTGGQGRADSLREWCAQVLKEKEQEADAQFFYFTSLPAHPDRLDLDLSPLSFFLRPVWAVPFQANQRIVLSP